MAKAKAEINKSEVIRKFFSEHPAATAKEVIAKLKAQGIEASEGLVYSLKPGKKKKKVAKGKAKAAPSSNGVPSVGTSIVVAGCGHVIPGITQLFRKISRLMQG